MALYTILFGVSIFFIALVSAIIKKMYYRWKEEHKIETMVVPKCVEHPTVSVIIYYDKCVVRRRAFAGNLNVFDVISKDEISLTKEEDSEQQSTNADNVEPSASLSTSNVGHNKST